jgi:hypothetical protein
VVPGLQKSSLAPASPRILVRSTHRGRTRVGTETCAKDIEAVKFADWHRRLSGDLPRIFPGRYQTGDVTFGGHLGMALALIGGQVDTLLSRVSDSSAEFTEVQEACTDTEHLDTVLIIGRTLHAERIAVHPCEEEAVRIRLARVTGSAWIVSSPGSSRHYRQGRVPDDKPRC